MLFRSPTLERQFHVQAKGVHEGGTVKRFDDRGKRRATPVDTGTRITNANAGPRARAPANGMIDLGKFREPDVPKKRQREREKERKPFITLHPPPVAAVRRCCTCEESESEERTWTATAQAAEPDSEYGWDQVAQRFVAFLYSHWHLAPSGLTSAPCSCGRYVLKPQDAPLGRE